MKHEAMNERMYHKSYVIYLLSDVSVETILQNYYIFKE